MCMCSVLYSEVLWCVYTARNILAVTIVVTSVVIKIDARYTTTMYHMYIYNTHIAVL